MVFVITITCLFYFDPFKPHFYIVKLGFTGVYIIFFLNFAQRHRLWVLGEAILTSTHNLCFEQKCEKNQNFLSENFHFLVIKFSVYLNRHVLVMVHIFMFFLTITSHSAILAEDKLMIYFLILAENGLLQSTQIVS